MVDLDEAKEILREYGLTENARTGDGKFHYFHDVLEGPVQVIHAELDIENGYIEFSSIIGMMTLSTGRYSFPHPKMKQIIHQLRCCAYAAECERWELLQR